MEEKTWKDRLRETAGRHSSAGAPSPPASRPWPWRRGWVFQPGGLPAAASWAQFDLTGSGIYDISDTSRTYLDGLEEDVEIHVLTDKDTLDSRIVRFLDIYADLSDHLTLEYTDPTVYPSALTESTAWRRHRGGHLRRHRLQESFDVSDIIGIDMMSYYYNGVYRETDFDGEGLLTPPSTASLTGATGGAYATIGHNETAVPISVEERFTRLHMSMERINLLTDGGIPDDCSLLIINEPDEDLADVELTMILDYLAQGGQVIYTMAGELVDLPNFNALCAAYGMTVVDGMIADTAQQYQNIPTCSSPRLTPRWTPPAACPATP